jgi:prephenate dehydratase
LNILARNIQDQNGNTTRFFVIAHKDNTIKYPDKKGKMTLLFQARDIPASLYKCLWAFATNNVNLTKIESIPSFQDPFMYTFRLEFEGTSTDENVRKSLNELAFFTKSIQVVGEY